MIGIKSLDKLPDICQMCPCFDVITVPYDGVSCCVPGGYVCQMCKAKRMILATAVALSNINDWWLHTERPEWCPLCEIEDNSRNEQTY